MDNPFEGSPIYSYGLRNPQGLAWDQEGNLYASDHGLRAHDEINRIIPGGNYGWPLVQGDETVEGMDIQVPLIQSMDVTWAPSGIDFVKEGPWEGRLLVTNLRGEQLLEVAITETEEGVSKAYAQPWLVSKYGRLRDVVSTKDGSIYIATNNRDGRGNPRIGDDRILRLVLRID
jgi:glucose/arabinose dehydrogenase